LWVGKQRCIVGLHPGLNESGDLTLVEKDRYLSGFNCSRERLGPCFGYLSGLTFIRQDCIAWPGWPPDVDLTCKGGEQHGCEDEYDPVAGLTPEWIDMQTNPSFLKIAGHYSMQALA
jgi:hypothetical protein